MTGSHALMTSDKREPSTTTAPRRRLAVGTLAVCAALFLGVIPSATAKTDKAKTVSAPASETAAPAVSTTPAPAPAVSGEPEAAGNVSTTTAKHAKKQTSGVSTATAPTGTAGTKTSNKGAGEAAGGSSEGSLAAAAKPAKKKSPKAKERAEEAHEAKRAEREVKTAERELNRVEKGRPPLEKGKVAPKTGTAPTPVATSPVAKPASLASLAPVADAASTAAVPAAVASAGTTTPTIESAAAQSAGHSVRRGRHQPRRGSAAPLSAAPAAAVTALGGGAPAAHHAAHTARPSDGAPARVSSAPQSPIVKTITRIVGVVPLAVRLLIGGLLALALLLAVRTGFVGLRARRLERQREQLLEDVGLLQAALLPAPPARLGPVGTSVAYRPAAGPGAGGDFYDVFALEDGQLAVIVGDISGHGRQALPHTALVRFTLRAYLEAGMTPRDAVQTAGAVLEHQLGGSFATVVAATYHPRDRVLVYACAGHPRPLVLGSSAEQSTVSATTVCSAPPIGVGMRTGTRQTVVSVPGQSQACFFTDGVVEARVGNELFGAERLTDALAGLGSQVTAAALLDRVVEETDRRPDDMAACMLSIEGGAGEPTILLEELEVDLDELASDRPEHLLLAYGVAPEEIAQFMSTARLEIGQSGTATLVLRFSEGQTHISLRHDNVTLMHASAVSARPRLRMSL
jgi:Stage II sporulation protein E (SpoIIE)